MEDGRNHEGEVLVFAGVVLGGERNVERVGEGYEPRRKH